MRTSTPARSIMDLALRQTENKATFDDLKAFPEGVNVEIIEGELRVAPRPIPAHGRIQRSLGGSIGSPYDDNADGDDAWWIIIEPDVQLNRYNLVIPDIVGWKRTTMPDFPQKGPIEVIPDWVCEVLSPSTGRHDRLTKADMYLRAGVTWLWLVDPDLRILECFERSEKGWLRIGAWADDASPKVAPFDKVSLPLGRIFPPKPREEDGDETPDAAEAEPSEP